MVNKKREVLWLTEYWANHQNDFCEQLKSTVDEWHEKIAFYLQDKNKIQLRIMLKELFNIDVPIKRGANTGEMSRATKIVKSLGWTIRKLTHDDLNYYISPAYKETLDKGKTKARRENKVKRKPIKKK